jgi:hypothetical protein
LSALIGAALLTDPRQARAARAVLAAVGLLYGAIGVLRLGVWLDVGLLAGAGLLAATTLLARR